MSNPQTGNETANQVRIAREIRDASAQGIPPRERGPPRPWYNGFFRIQRRTGDDWEIQFKHLKAGITIELANGFDFDTANAIKIQLENTLRQRCDAQGGTTIATGDSSDGSTGNNQPNPCEGQG